MILVLLASFLLVAASPFPLAPSRLKIKNRTDDLAYVWMLSGETYYYFKVQPGIWIFTVERKVYRSYFRFCNRTSFHRLNLEQGLQITLPSCDRRVPAGEDRMFKIRH